MPLTLYKSLMPHVKLNSQGVPVDLRPSSTRISAYGCTQIMQHGTCILTVCNDSREIAATFYVVNKEGPVILGLPTCRSLELVILKFSINATQDTKVATKILQKCSCKVMLLPRARYGMISLTFSQESAVFKVNITS